MICINFLKNYTYMIKKELREMYKLPIKNLDLNRIDIFEQLVKATESLGILKGTLNKFQILISY